MTQYEEYQGKNQRLGYLIQLLTFFITMNKSANHDLLNEAIISKLTTKIRSLAHDEVQTKKIDLEVI